MKGLTDLEFAVVLTLPTIAFLLTLVAYPLGYSIWLSTQKVTFFGGLKFSSVGLGNYAKALSTPDFWHSLGVSMRFMAESLVLTMAIGLAIALILNQTYRFGGLVRSLVILPWGVSLYATGILFKYFLRGKSGFLTALAYAVGIEKSVDMLNKNIVVESLAIGNSWNLAPLVGFFIFASMQSIPKGLYALAKIDNMGVLKQFWHVTLPHIRYTLFVFVNIIAVLSLRTFDIIYVQTGGGPGISSAALTYQIYKESFLSMNIGYGAALSFYLLIVIIATTLFLYIIWGRKEKMSV